MILSSKHASESSTATVTPVRRSERVGSSGNDSALVDENLSSPSLFPAECFVCGKYRLQHSKRNERTRQLLTRESEITIKMAARDKIPSFFYENESVDLIAKELKFHRSCYKNFTLGYSKVFRERVNVTLQDENQPEEVQEQGDYEAVKQYVDQHVLLHKNAVSLNVLHTVYGLRPNDSRYRLKLKNRIKKDFAHKVSFLSVGNKTPEIIIDASISPTEMAFQDKEGCIIKAAEYLRNDVLTHCEGLPELSWPPQLEELKNEERNPPDSLMLFYKFLLQSQSTVHKKSPEYVERLVRSFASDIIGAVSQGKTITEKQFLLALGLHNITGQRKVMEIVNRLGHSLTYNTTCEAETSFAAKAQQQLSNALLPLRPLNQDGVLTVFWVDNFDVKAERQTGSTSVHTTHMIAFQEKGENLLQENVATPIARTRKRKLQEETDRIHDRQSFVNPKIEPPFFTDEPSVTAEEHVHLILLKYFLWLWIRKQNSFDQLYPSFSGEGTFTYYRKPPKISPGLILVQRPFLEGLLSGVGGVGLMSGGLRYIINLRGGVVPE